MACLEILDVLIGGEVSASLPLPADAPAAGFLVPKGRGGLPELAAVRPPGCPAAFLLARRRWVVMACGGASVRVGGEPVVAIRVLDHGDVVEAGGLALRLCEEEEEVLTAGSPLVVEGRTCPFCLGAFQADDLIMRCPIDQLPQHVKCLELNRGKCASRPWCEHFFKPRASAAAP